VHGANGYLLDQFWKDSSNTRTDGYGGSDANKARLLLEVMEAVAGAVGAERVGLRLSPYNTFLDAQDSVERAIEKNVWLMKELDARVPGLAYIHMV
jgi:N-ethylmaleimide reductase